MRKLGIIFCVFLGILLGTYIIQGRAEPKKEAKETKAETKTEDMVYAVVNNVKITQKDFDEEVASIPANYRAMVNTNKKKFLDDLVLQELLTQEARKKGLDKDKEFLASLEKIKSKLLAKRLIEKDIVDKVTVSEDEIKKYYEEHKDEFAIPEQVNASHILIMVKESATEDEKKAASKKTEDILKKIKEGGDFTALAKEHSECPSKEKGGELGFFSKGQMVPEFEEAAFKLKPGEVSEIVKTKFGYHIIKVTDKKPAGEMTFDEVKADIEQKLMREKQKTAFDEYTNKLKEKAKITVNEEALK